MNPDHVFGQLVATLVLLLSGQGATRAADGAPLAREATLAALLASALEHSPDLGAERERAAAASERADAAGRLPTPELKYELWSVPFAAPLSFHRAMMHMVGLRQRLPALGSRDAISRAAAADSAIAQATRDTRTEELIAQVRRAFAEYRTLEEEVRVRLEHAGLLSRLMEVARSVYQTGAGTIQDQLRIDAELARLHAEISSAMQQRRTAGALLNSLIGRSPDAPLGPPSAGTVPGPAAAEATDAPATPVNRPEVISASREIEKRDAVLDAARRAARYPDFMVGVDYMNQPLEHEQHGYGAMVSMSLPWLNPASRASERAEERSLMAAKREFDAVKLVAGYEVVTARDRYRTAKEILLIQDERAVPAARQSFELAQRTYASGGGDLTILIEAERAYLLARLERARASARVEIAGAELDRATGTGSRFTERLVGRPQ